MPAIIGPAAIPPILWVRAIVVPKRPISASCTNAVATLRRAGKKPVPSEEADRPTMKIVGLAASAMTTCPTTIVRMLPMEMRRSRRRGGRNLSRALEAAGRMRSRAERFVIPFREMRKLACLKSGKTSSGE